MSKCKHIRRIIITDLNKCRITCSCGDIKTNWHDHIYKARIAFKQEYDYHNQQVSKIWDVK